MTALADPTARLPPSQGCGDIKRALCPRFFRANPQGLTLQRGYISTFLQLRSTFLLLGGVLSAVVALVGVLNFLIAVLTSMLSRRREFAVLQAVGMTNRQLNVMLMTEGLFYALLACCRIAQRQSIVDRLRQSE